LWCENLGAFFWFAIILLATYKPCDRTVCTNKGLSFFTGCRSVLFSNWNALGIIFVYTYI
jgi:hypothetical protein